ncbi:MAG: nucleotidyltransferase domain-containing protein [Cellulomonadaceae bacterium]|jgi:predicted nucleotidyltransferase|nr:nucleotidyltransferase domain-containing protein [Cellulomonadaceae bacterium]
MASSRPSAALAKYRDEVVARLEAADAYNVRVFGSVARGEDTPESDIDLLIDPGTNATAFGISSAKLDLVELLGFSVDLVSSRAIPQRKSSIVTDAITLNSINA